MRRSRTDDNDDKNEFLVSELPIPEQRPPNRKRRRTFLESFQTMSLMKGCDDSSDEGNSSCATGGSLNETEVDVCIDDDDDDESSLEHEDILLSDQEKFHRAMMYQLATGKIPTKRVDVVRDRLEKMIRQSRLQAAVAQDDFHVEFQREDDAMMDVEPIELKRSNSLPRNFEQFDGGSPPVDMVEIHR